jgi:hypothetical protein
MHQEVPISEALKQWGIIQFHGGPTIPFYIVHPPMEEDGGWVIYPNVVIKKDGFTEKAAPLEFYSQEHAHALADYLNAQHHPSNTSVIEA